MTRVVLYARVSTEDQAREGFSLDAQIDRLHSFAKAKGWTVVGEYIDEGHSGRTVKRPQYARMMEDVRSWDTLLVLKMDRIHRNSRNFMEMMSFLNSERREFASVTESLDTTTAMGRFVADMIQRIAQLESDQIGERTMLGMTQKAKQGAGGLGKPAPFGYRYRQDGTLAPVAKEADAVLRTFEEYSLGVGKQALANRLNAQGFVGRKGAPIRLESISWMLQNPTYMGDLRWNGILQLDKHPPIVPRWLFNRVQVRLAQRKVENEACTD